MTGVQTELDSAFRLLCAISVKGDSVELMAEAKRHLRKAFNLCEPPKQREDAQNG